MNYNFLDKSIQYTGRWGELDNSMVATSAGSYFDIFFYDDNLLLKFDVSNNPLPRPHLWISIDGNDGVEVEVSPFIRLRAKKNIKHRCRVILKSSVEVFSRWKQPLHSGIRFLGYDGCASEPIRDTRKTIEFVGDSITEGVFTDMDYNDGLPYSDIDQQNRVFQDDVCATFAWRLSEMMDIRPYFMAYAAVGTTKAGNGGVPDVITSYPYNFENSKVTYPHPDMIVIHHGTNDRRAELNDYLEAYEKLLKEIRELHPNSIIVALSLFVGVRCEEFCEMIKNYNIKNHEDIRLVNTSGWVSAVPHHPTREMHKIISEHLYPILSDFLK